MKFDVRSLEKHQLEPNKTLDEYAKGLRVQLGENIKNCQKIYLDTNYWLELRDVILQRQKNTKFVYLLELLRNGAEEGKLICPISDENFYEILQQSDQKTLSASTILIDELSKGISLISAEERIRLEILYFVNRNVYGEASVYPHDTFVWSKVSYIFGMMHPSFSALSTKEELIFQKSFLDHMWSISFSEMIEVIGMENILYMPKFRDISKEINENKIKYAHQNNSFKQLFLSEIAGVVDLYRPLFEEALAYLYEKETGQKPSSDEIKIANPGKAANSIYHLFRKNKLGDFFPTLIIGAGLHASVRHDLKRKFKSNDMSDFRHAQAALPYYNCFFTEHSLRDLVTRKNIRFDSKYNCDVSSDPSDALQSVKKICS
jgi:hypothetical protein